MVRYSTSLRTLLTLSIVFAGVSASEAGLFGRWRACSDEPARPPAMVSTPREPAIPAADQTKVSTTGPIVYTVAKPVVGENPDGALSVPRNRSNLPVRSTSPGTAWSTTPRSSWDFGKFPPYSN